MISFRTMILSMIASTLLFTTYCMAKDDQHATKITQKPWEFARSNIIRFPWSPPLEELRQKQSLQKVRGWVEYEFDVSKAGWYELWLGKIPASWSRDIHIDGAVIFRMSQAVEPDDLENPKDKKSLMKEVNIFLAQGKHSLRIERMDFPGTLPSHWELRYAGNNPEGCIRVDLHGDPLVAPGTTLKATVYGGTDQPTAYDLVLLNHYNQSETPLATVKFPATESPMQKEVEIPLQHEGIYEIRARINGKLLRPNSTKCSPMIATASRSKDVESRKLPDQLILETMFRDHAVLQRQKPVPVWGWAPPGASVTVTFAGQTQSSTADESGAWQVTLSPMEAGGPHVLTAKTGTETVTIRDVLVGEVWIFGGQSNMGAPVQKITNGPEVMRQANESTVRQFILRNKGAGNGSPSGLVSSGWINAVYDKQKRMRSVQDWNGIVYAFCSRLHKELGIPVAGIVNNRGGTTITTWTSIRKQETTPAFARTLNEFRKKELAYLTHHQAAVSAWYGIRAWNQKHKMEGADEEKRPQIENLYNSVFRDAGRNHPADHYSMLVKPLAPFAIRGICWYQGESDSGSACRYREMFPAMIKDWRELWREPDLPFLYVQIAQGGKPTDGPPPAKSKNAEMQEAQLLALSVPQTAVIATHDLPVPDDNVHFKDKFPVGNRLAQAALSIVYGKDVCPMGPIYDSYTVERDKIRVRFRYIDGGLVIKGKTLGGFAIAGADRKWVWAKANIDGDSVLVWNETVPEPKAVRYGWCGTNCGANLYNQAGLPAPVFRTDDWPGESDDK